jgi:glutamate mutase epsilon subunit
MAIETVVRQIAVGAQQNVRVLTDDLELLKSLKEHGEDSLAVTFHRVITTYHQIKESGNFVRIANGEAVNG